jgi:hypothetical protein
VTRFSLKRPARDFAQTCVNPQELERLRLPKPIGPTRLGGEAPELDQPGLVLVQLQPERCEPVAQIGPEPFGVVSILEAHHQLIGEPDHDHVAAGVPSPPLAAPKVEHVLEVDVREQPRERRPLRCPLHRLRALPILDDPRPQPFLDQADDPFVR